MKFKNLQPVTVFCALVFLYSCKKEVSTNVTSDEMVQAAAKSDQAIKLNTFYGPQEQMGNGKVRSFVVISHTGVPKEIGMELTSEAFNGLPSEGETAFYLPLHQKASEVTPFDHLEIDWNPHGHPPPNVYTVPHFDFHFYKISMEEHMAIPAYSPATAALFDNFPPPGYLPPSYFPGPGGVAKMGKHWLNGASPELNPSNPQPFTKTFIYGTYNAKVIFIEPMVTLAVLQSGQTHIANIPQPQNFSPTGTYYPTKYNIYMDETTGKHYVSLSDFVWK